MKKIIVLIMVLFVAGNVIAWDTNPTYDPFEVIWNSINELYDKWSGHDYNDFVNKTDFEEHQFENLVKNGGFELFTDGDNTYPNWWGLLGEYEGGVTSVGRESGYKSDSAVGVLDGVNNKRFCIQQEVYSEGELPESFEGGMLTLSVWVKWVLGITNGEIAINDGLTRSEIALGGNSEWHQVVLNHVVSTSATKLSIELCPTSEEVMEAAMYVFDNVMLTKGEYEPLFNPNLFDRLAEEDFIIKETGAELTGDNPGLRMTSDLVYWPGYSFELISNFYDPDGDGGADPEFLFEIKDVNANKDRLIITDDGNIGIGTTNPGVALDVNGSIIRKINYAAGHGIDITPSGALNRYFTFIKVHDDTGIRVNYVDNFRVYKGSGDAGCRWEIKFDDNSCSDPGGLYYDFYNSVGADDIRRSSSMFGTCWGLGKGEHEIQVYVSPTVSGSTCYTGWNNQYWSIEAEEVRSAVCDNYFLHL